MFGKWDWITVGTISLAQLSLSIFYWGLLSDKADNHATTRLKVANLKQEPIVFSPTSSLNSNDQQRTMPLALYQDMSFPSTADLFRRAGERLQPHPLVTSPALSITTPPWQPTATQANPSFPPNISILPQPARKAVARKTPLRLLVALPQPPNGPDAVSPSPKTKKQPELSPPPILPVTQTKPESPLPRKPEPVDNRERTPPPTPLAQPKQTKPQPVLSKKRLAKPLPANHTAHCATDCLLLGANSSATASPSLTS